MRRRTVWVLCGIAVLLSLVIFDVLPAKLVLAPLLGLFIYAVGVASLGSLRRGASYIPDGPPEAVDLDRERTVYWCGGCGAELLLVVRGTSSPPRHCGERMSEHVEVERSAPTPH